MNFQQTELYKRIQAFALDWPDSQLSFSQRLAKDNGWSLGYTQRVIEEYKKFIFLAVAAGHPVTPSDQIDQVWHLHLTYTRSYWQEFCPKILQTTLHHEPTRGGSSEQLKFGSWYSKTLESYEQFFGHIPPIDIWPKPKDRFGRDLHFIRINTQQSWILSKPNFTVFFKPQLRKIGIFTFLVLLSLMITSCQIISQIPNPINFTGSEFLTFYIFLGVMGIALAAWLRFSLCLVSANTKQQPDLNTYEIAFLAGGNHRMIMAAITSLVKQGYVEVLKEGKLVVTGKIDPIADPVEKAVAQDILATDGAIEQVFQNSTGMKDSIRSRLEQLGLFLSDAQAFKAQIYPSMIVVILLGIGFCKMAVGISRDKPVGLLLICIFGLLVLGARFFVKPQRSRYGEIIFNDLTNRLQPLKTANSSDSELVLAVALFGATVLMADMALADLYQMLTPTAAASSGSDGSSDGGSGGSDGSSDGGSGGGCGGCGGCGGGD
ncbi:MAG: TIGR04222 domain-containing membrane protein [Microcystis aeruginosa G11-01]|uniref:TIGR04222 domain-containing membrane protein n=1 Tax=Microcystis aeruginosa G11-04 TaxID=2685956 RepID=A0A966G297_MICAE|nr:TIGR04222 domain-containing membrane protein [Microcystis aeruginosa LE13-04]NCR89485.1 TIGR04222 domain-containing membrane protein [Microcystis aeruginosa G13-10]NCS33443.1 TIGR04222 domain-containing membrane protein [Microcystis aeruginosa G11-01]NCS53488.1 TIGR04222 domain-containing membrane protein [Microcystis aeruginosa G13-05]NCS58140.1 TIGR04222 domain-containing membrane protein [Microcystis aeruginosa G11-04]NCT42940.1 TIGR04222 domain-containing membrane protein [Microcystis a